MKPPKGYRMLRRGTLIELGDKVWLHFGWNMSGNMGCKVGDADSDFYYCRKLKRKAKR